MTVHTYYRRRKGDAPFCPHCGQPALTEREGAVLRERLRGLSNAEVAERLGIGYQTVKKHVGRAYERFGVSTVLELLPYAIAHGIAPSETTVQQDLQTWLFSLPIEPDVAGKAVRELQRAEQAHPEWPSDRLIQVVVAFLASEEQRHQRKSEELRHAWRSIGTSFKKRESE
jgi:DNA-binding CsgD family transcriptional regulator